MYQGFFQHFTGGGAGSIIPTLPGGQTKAHGELGLVVERGHGLGGMGPKWGGGQPL